MTASAKVETLLAIALSAALKKPPRAPAGRGSTTGRA
jgi:hypothetical protein